MSDRARDLAGEPGVLRERFRRGELARPTAGLAPGFVQANLVVLPRDLAFDFLLFAQRNPKPCPVLEVLEAGQAEPRLMARGADIRTDLPKYRVYERGVLVAEPSEIAGRWRDDLVSFLIGCSFTFEAALIEAGIPVRHVEQRSNVPMYVTSIPTAPAGAFHGPMVVSMRPIPADKVVRAVQVTSRFPSVHGAPVHVGDPGAIGVADIDAAGPGRSGGDSTRRGAGLLGVRRDPAGGGDGVEAAADVDARAGPHVRDRPARRRVLRVLKTSSVERQASSVARWTPDARGLLLNARR